MQHILAASPGGSTQHGFLAAFSAAPLAISTLPEESTTAALDNDASVSVRTKVADAEQQHRAKRTANIVPSPAKQTLQKLILVVSGLRWPTHPPD